MDVQAEGDALVERLEQFFCYIREEGASVTRTTEGERELKGRDQIHIGKIFLNHVSPPLE